MIAVSPLRKQLVAEAGECMACGSKRGLAMHEILNGPLRDLTLDEPCSLLCLCWICNADQFTDKKLWRHARQLALLQSRSPKHYNLERFCWLRNPDAPMYIIQEEVDAYTSTLP